MRNLIFCLAVATGAGAFATVAGAAPLPPAPITFDVSHAQTVQYHSQDWRRRQEMRRRAEMRRREEMRHHPRRDRHNGQGVIRRD